MLEMKRKCWYKYNEFVKIIDYENTTKKCNILW